FFTVPPPSALYTLSLHDALPICALPAGSFFLAATNARHEWPCAACWPKSPVPGLLPEPFVLPPVTAALAPKLLPSAPTPNCGAAWPRRILALLVLGKPSHTSSR